MAHLIKLEDYISRYQLDMQRYPNQFTRMKKERWYYLKNEWEQLKLPATYERQISDEGFRDETSINLWSSTVKKLKNWRRLRRLKSNQMDVEEDRIEPINGEEHNRITLKAKNLDHLKQLFLDDLYASQLNWASSSLLEQSYINPKYKFDQHLRFFAQQLPDNYFLMYSPVFWIKQAPVDMDIILITPSEIQCITILDGSEHSVFQASSDRFWSELVKKKDRKRLSPVVTLNRMASIISDILKQNNCEFPIKKTVLAKECFIDNKAKGLKVELIDRRTFTQWHDKLKKHPSPIKGQQLKVAKLLLDNCHTSAHVRQVLEIEAQEENE